MKKGGRTLFIFLVLIIVILVSGVFISLFLLQSETAVRKAAEQTIDDLTIRNTKVTSALKDSRKEIDVLQAKKKDIEDRVNGLLEEMDLEKALNEKIKTDNKKLRDDLETAARNRIEMRQKLIREMEAVHARLREAEHKAAGQEKAVTDFQQKIANLQKLNDELEQKIKTLPSVVPAAAPVPARQPRNEIIPPSAPAMQEKVDLDRIVVTPDSAREGHVLNVDAETEFLIFDLGARHGIKESDIMSVYRGKAYLGDVRVSRVQEEMSAADFIPPFSSRKVRKNDQVVAKR